MRSLDDLSKEKLDKLVWVMFHACQGDDPWADMMYLQGAGDEGTDHFPFDLDTIERIDISFGGEQESQESPEVH